MAELDRLGDLLPAMKPGGGQPGSRPAGGGRPGPASDEETGRRLAEVWAQVAGTEVAGNARPVQFRGGRLVVTTSSSAWAQTLQLMGPMLVGKLNERLGEEAVTKVVFRHAGWDPAWATPAEVPAPEPPSGASAAGTATSPSAGSRVAADGFTADEREALGEVDALPLPPAVKESIREAMKAGFNRARQDSGRS